VAGCCAPGSETWGVIKDWKSHYQLMDRTPVCCFVPYVLAAVIFAYKQKHHILHNLYQLSLFIFTWKSRVYFNHACCPLLAYHSDICKLFYVMDSFMCHSKWNPLNLKNRIRINLVNEKQYLCRLIQAPRALGG
jgi:hypothetical protein